MKKTNYVLIACLTAGTLATGAYAETGTPAAPAAKPATMETGTPAAPAAQSIPAAKPATLNGSFKGKIAMEGKKSGDKDTLIFNDGKFLSTACKKYGFMEAPFQANMNGEKTNFMATVTNKKGEKMEWNGTVDGKTISATAVYTDKKGNAKKYTFTQAKKT